MRTSYRFLSLMVVMVILSACVPATPAATRRTLTMMTHDSFAASEAVIDQFEQQHDVDVQFIKASDAGSALNQAILSKDNPLADVFFGVDNTFLSRALDAGIFEPYAAPALADIPTDMQLDPDHRLLPIDFGYVCLNYDRKYFAEKNLPVPQTLEDLVRPEYRSLLVVENPATSSPGLAFLAASVAHFGEDKYLDWWKALRDNDVLVTDGWEDAYYNQFSGSSGQGPRPLVVSYATSPAAEVYFSEGQLSEPPTGNILPEGACFRQIEFAGILRGAAQPELAQQWIDFMLSPTFQEDVPLQMFVYPANRQAKLPALFQQYAAIPQQPAQIEPITIASQRDAWIDAWTTTVLR